MDKIIVIAFITEALWETLKLSKFKDQNKVNFDRIGVMLLGILVAVAGGLDLFDVSGINLKIPYLGSVLTGLLISRGSNFVHDIMGSMGKVYQIQKNKPIQEETKANVK